METPRHYDAEGREIRGGEFANRVRVEYPAGHVCHGIVLEGIVSRVAENAKHGAVVHMICLDRGHDRVVPLAYCSRICGETEKSAQAKALRKAVADRTTAPKRRRKSVKRKAL